MPQFKAFCLLIFRRKQDDAARRIAANIAKLPELLSPQPSAVRMVARRKEQTLTRRRGSRQPAPEPSASDGRTGTRSHSVDLLAHARTDARDRREKNASISWAARSGSSRWGKWPTPGKGARPSSAKVSPSRSVHA
jgi:hypothetical protein